MAERTTSNERKTMSVRVALAALVALAASAMFSIPAQASQPIEFFKVNSEQTEAGAHPDISTEFTLPGPESGQPEEVAKTIEVKWPTGVFGNPQAVPRCSNIDFALNECPSFSQVGWIGLAGKSGPEADHIFGAAPVYDMEPSGEEETARLAFTVPEVNIPINMPIKVRTGSEDGQTIGDYGLTVGVTGITQELPLRQANLTLWGFPAEGTNDNLRFPIGSPGEPAGCPGQLIPNPSGCADLSQPIHSGILVRPLIDNPTVCTHRELPVELVVHSYKDPNPSTAVAQYPETTDCSTEVFRPVFDVGLTTAEADTPSGLNLRLVAKQVLGHTNSPSELRSAYLTLPPGLSVNPDAADGQSACTDAEAGFGSELPSRCPDNSKIGTVEVHTPALDGALKGALYIGEPKPGNQYRLFMLFDGFGIHAKLAPDIVPDPETGQLSISLTDLPQVPFEEFDLHLFSSDRGLMATPTKCGIYGAEGEFVPWNDQASPQKLTPNFEISSGADGSPCPGAVRDFHPSLSAGTTTPVAGAFSSFILKLDREDGDQFLGDLDFTMPPGLTADLRGVTYCSDSAIAAAAQSLGRAEAASPSCPASSEIGSSNVAAGPGSHPFHAVGKLYLAGPFKGAPLSLVAITPALAGPYDYGTVVVRVAIDVDPTDAHVVAVSDTVPSIIGGIPIRMRSIQVNIERPNFMLNPTNCDPFSIESRGIGDEGTAADFSSFFEAVNCKALAFKPDMTLRQLGGPGATARSRDPKLQFDLRTRPGDANIKSLAVTLPKAFEIDQEHIGNLCSKAELESKRCAGRQAIGFAKTETPLLEKPLEGPAYAVSGYGGLPHVVFVLGGQISLLPGSQSKTVRGGELRTEVPVVPDAPIGHFRLTLLGGKHGYISNTRSLCAGAAFTTVEYTAQNGRTYSQRVKLKAACGHRATRHKRKHR